MLEDIRSEFRIVAEKVGANTHKIESLTNQVGGLTEMVARNCEDITMIKLDIREIKTELSRKADREEVLELRHKITRLS